MTKKYLDNNGLSYFFSKLKTMFATKDIATTSSNGLMSSADKIKLDGIGQLVESATGESVTASDSSGLESLIVYGKSVQNGTPTPSSPVPIGVVQGTNYLDVSTLSPTSTTSISLVENGVRIISTSDGTYRNANRLIEGLNLIEGETYTLKAYVFVTSGKAEIGIRSSSNVLKAYSDVLESDGWCEFSFTYDPSNHYRLAFFVTLGTSGAGDVTFTNVMLEKGSTATPYIPYGSIGLKVDSNITPINLQGNVLASLPDGTKDVLTVDSVGHVVLDKAIHVITFDGTENWKAYAAWNSADQYCYYLSQSYYSHYVNSAVNILCDYLQGTTYNNFVNNNNNNSIILSSSGKEITMRVPISTLANFKTWISGKSVIVGYTERQTIDLGYIDMPDIPDNASITISASLTPEISASWWTEYAEAIARTIKSLIGLINQ